MKLEGCDGGTKDKGIVICLTLSLTKNFVNVPSRRQISLLQHMSGPSQSLSSTLDALPDDVELRESPILDPVPSDSKNLLQD